MSYLINNCGMDIKEIRLNNLRHYMIENCASNASELARRIRRSPSQVNDLFANRKSFGEKFARGIEPLMGVNPGWLDTEITATPFAAETRAKYGIPPTEAPNLELSAAEEFFKPRPLLNNVTAGGFREAIDNIHPDEAELIYPKTASGGPCSAWLKIENDSMEPRFRAGDLILVDPDKQWDHGDFVVAANGDGHWTFKQLIRDGIDWYLRPLNSAYPLKRLDEHIIIIGKAIEHQPKPHKL